MVHQRKIEKKWSAQLERRSDVHSAALVLPPGNWEAFDPFLGMAEDVMRKGAFDHHPHRGIETVTYMIDGELSHYDNAGNGDNLSAGDVQWMNAGKGIIHLEEAPEGKFAHILQLWVNLPADKKMSEPYYQNIKKVTIPVVKREGVVSKVISGKSGDVISDTRNNAPVKMLEISVENGHTVAEFLEPDYNGFIYILEGCGIFGANVVEGKKGNVLWMQTSENAESEISIKATSSKLKLLLIAGKPLREPVVAQGPFVMNTEEQIREAYQDYRLGKFGNI